LQGLKFGTLLSEICIYQVPNSFLNDVDQGRCELALDFDASGGGAECSELVCREVDCSFD
jgi:hypothetical protein